MKKPLGLILQEKAFLEAEIEEAHGEITEELDSIWENNQMELAEKVDNYAWVLKHLDAVIANIRERKQKADKIIRSLTNQQERIKHRLRYYCDISGGPLRGHEYTFHPFNSVKREVNMEKVERERRKVVVTMPLDRFMASRYLQKLAQAGEAKVEHPKLGVSELPKDHPAIMAEETPTVTMR
jgi:chaperonin cofactor prefoldin